MQGMPSVDALEELRRVKSILQLPQVFEWKRFIKAFCFLKDQSNA